MNPTIDALNTHRSAAKATSQARINRLAAADTKTPPPAADQPYAGEKAIAHPYKRALQACAYFRKQTAAALLMMIVFGVVAVLVPLVFGITLMTAAITIFAILATGISGYHWWFKKWGPALITEARFEAAKQQLADSGDLHTPPLPLLPLIVLVAIMLVDGFLSGSSLANTVFANMFTPRVALAAAIAWGVGVTYLLFKVVISAATESAINERRSVIRNLAVSANPDDRALAIRMKAAVGGKLLNDYDTRSNRYTARVGLVVTVLVLAGATFLMRASPEPDAAPAQAQPAVMRT